MGLNETPSANRLHIGFFGKRNAGKSSVVNAVTGQNLAIVRTLKDNHRPCLQSNGAFTFRAGCDN